VKVAPFGVEFFVDEVPLFVLEPVDEVLVLGRIPRSFKTFSKSV